MTVQSPARAAYAAARTRARRSADPQRITGGPAALAAVAAMTRRCRCGHMVLLHEITPRGVRSWCSYASQAGRCPCTACEIAAYSEAVPKKPRDLELQKKSCPTCKGSGLYRGGVCPDCEGDGDRK